MKTAYHPYGLSALDESAVRLARRACCRRGACSKAPDAASPGNNTLPLR